MDGAEKSFARPSITEIKQAATISFMVKWRKYTTKMVAVLAAMGMVGCAKTKTFQITSWFKIEARPEYSLNWAFQFGSPKVSAYLRGPSGWRQVSTSESACFIELDEGRAALFSTNLPPQWDFLSEQSASREKLSNYFACSGSLTVSANRKHLDCTERLGPKANDQSAALKIKRFDVAARTTTELTAPVAEAGFGFHPSNPVGYDAQGTPYFTARILDGNYSPAVGAENLRDKELCHMSATGQMLPWKAKLIGRGKGYCPEAREIAAANHVSITPPPLPSCFQKGVAPEGVIEADEPRN